MSSRGDDLPAVSRKRPYEPAAAPPAPISGTTTATTVPPHYFQQHQLHAASSASVPALLPKGSPGTTTTTALPAHHPTAASASLSASGGVTMPVIGKPVPALRTSKDKGYKGLRQFSMLVCKKVEEKGTTTYNEVADELVLQVMQEKHEHGVIDEKNIRRRVYDALNVLMAMDIIAKDKKAITWKGLPTSATQDLDLLGRERDFRAAELSKKRQQLQDLLIQQVCFRNLTARNAERGDVEPGQKIPLPFIIVNTASTAVIQCNMSKDLTDVMFDFSMPFEINDDNTILKRLGMHKTDMTALREMMPADMLQYCQEHGLLDAMLQDSAMTPPSKKSAPSAVAKGPRLASGDYDAAQGRKSSSRGS